MNEFPIEPLGDRLIVKQTEAAGTTAGGIIIPDSAREAPKEGCVVAVGPGRKTEAGEILPIQIEGGDHIVFASYAGELIQVDGDEFILLKEDEVLAKVRS